MTPLQIRWTLRIAGGLAAAVAAIWPETAMLAGPVSAWLIGYATRAPGDARE